MDDLTESTMIKNKKDYLKYIEATRIVYKKSVFC